MKRTILCAGATFSVWLAVACTDSTDPGILDRDTFHEETVRWSGQIAPGGRIEIKGVNGSVRAAGTSGGEVVVSATKSSQRSNVSEVHIEVLQHAEGVTICAVYPDVPGQPANECLPGNQGRMNVQDNDVSVDFTVDVPAGVVFVGYTVNGYVSADGMDGDAFVATVNGDVTLSTTQLGEAATVNGTIDASIGLTDWDRDLSFATVNGNVTVTIPAATNAEVRLTSVSGSVWSDFPLPGFLPNHRGGTIGSGGRILTVTAVNGNVALRWG